MPAAAAAAASAAQHDILHCTALHCMAWLQAYCLLHPLSPFALCLWTHAAVDQSTEAMRAQTEAEAQTLINAGW